jgi:transposase-like protein
MTDDNNAPDPGDLASLRSELADYKKALDELKAASTPAEKEEAREDVEDAEADLGAVARKLGISPSALRKATADAKRAEQKENLRPIIQELLDELVGDDDEDEPEKPVAEEKPKRERAPKKEADSAPVVTHWSDRSVMDLLR